MGVDPGLNHTGFGVIDVYGNELKFVTAGVINVPKGELAERLRFIFTEVGKIARETTPSFAACEKVFVNIGEADSDPVFCISDLLVHLAQEQMSKDAKSVIEGEALNLIVGGRPLADEEKDAVKANVLKILKDKYDVEEAIKPRFKP